MLKLVHESLIVEVYLIVVRLFDFFGLRFEITLTFFLFNAVKWTFQAFAATVPFLILLLIVGFFLLDQALNFVAFAALGKMLILGH